MAKTPDWKHIKFSRADGVSEAVLHMDGGPLVWSAAVAREFSDLLNRVAMDSENKVLILGGTGDIFCAKIDPTEYQAMSWRQIWSAEQMLLPRLINLNTIVISAVNGPVYVHSDIPVMADIVIACPEVEFSDSNHFKRSVVPGDGVQLVWGEILGSSRASYFHLTGQRISAAEAKQLGAVHEIHPRDSLLPRARELAQGLAKRPSAVLAYTKAVLRLRDRRNFRQDLSHSLSLQGLGSHAAGYYGSE